MISLIQSFPDQLSQGLDAARANPWQPDNGGPLTEIVLMGLGGSAFGGEVLRNYLYDRCALPYLIYRGYTAPAHVGPHSLVILSSYSGNTEETLEAAKDARRRGARIVVVSSGGQLADWSHENAEAWFRMPAGYPPRSACGFSIVQQLEILFRLGLISDFADELKTAIERLRSFNGHESLKAVANQCQGRWVAIYSEDRIESVAIRLRQQINENAKQLCHHHALPEMNHNELVGWPLPVGLPKLFLYLRHAAEHPRNRLRIAFMQELAREMGVEQAELSTDAESPLVALFDLLHQSDWLSCYLAELNGVDPTPVQVIDRLKSSLAERV